MVTIEADEEVWRYLQVRKSPGDSFNDVLRRELGLEDAPDPDAGAAGGDDPVEALLAEWAPDTEADATRARDETRRVVAWLREQDTPQTRSAIVDACAGTSELGERSWWERCVQPGLRHLAERGLVEYRPGHHDYAVDDQRVPQPRT